MAGITADTPDPEGGHIGHFADGRPNGYMQEVAASQLLIRAKSAQNYQQDVTNMRNTSDHYLANGLVAIGELMGRKQPMTHFGCIRMRWLLVLSRRLRFTMFGMN